MLQIGEEISDEPRDLLLGLIRDGQSVKSIEKASPDIALLDGIGGYFTNRAGVSEEGSENPLGMRCY